MHSERRVGVPESRLGWPSGGMLLSGAVVELGRLVHRRVVPMLARPRRARLATVDA